jgi:hypothetical protein
LTFALFIEDPESMEYSKLTSSENLGSSVPRYNTQNTNQPQLRFHAVLGNGDRRVRLEWGV